MFSFTIFPSWVVTTLLVVLMLSIFVYTLRLINRWSSMARVPKLPPNPPKLPVIGNLHQLFSKLRHQALCELSKKYGPIMLLHIGSKPFLVISSPSMAKQILKTQDHIFCSRPMSKAANRLSYNYSDVALSPHNSHWKVMRKVFVSEFIGPKRAGLFNRVLVAEIETMVQSLSPNVVVNLNDLFLAILKGAVCKVAFGNNYREQPLNGPSWEVMITETMVMLNGSLGDSFPWLGRFIDQFSGWNSRLEKCFRNIDAYIEMIIDDHYNHAIKRETNDDDKDFVHSLVELSMAENVSGAYRLTIQDVKALVMDVLTGGTPTTLVTMVWAMFEIVRNGRVMQKLQTEIGKCTTENERKQVPDITNMKYLKMVVKETLRLHPPVPLLLPHECLSHCQINGYDIFPGTTVLINGWAIGRDPNTWGENAAEFYPERFENLDVDIGGADFDMVPFGGGRRSCPGMNMAPTTVELTIASLLYRFHWEVPDGLKNEYLNMEEEGTLIVRKKLPLLLMPINHN